MALLGIELATYVYEKDAITARPNLRAHTSLFGFRTVCITGN